MSPKKRRPAGRRGRGPTPRRTTPAVEALHDALLLTDPTATRLAAELWASHYLGLGWATAPPGVREPEREVLASIVDEARRRPSRAAAAALAACRIVLPDASLDTALAELGHPVPPWAATVGSAPVRAWRSSDPWRSREAWFLDYGAHVLMASVRHPGGTHVEELTVMGADALSRFDQLARDDERIGRRVEAPLAEAVRETLAALEWTELTWPREPSRSYAEQRLLARARLAALPDAEEEPDVDRLPDDVRERLRAEFLDGETGEAEQYVAELFLDYAGGYLHDPLLWSPDDAELFLLDWVPRKVVLTDAERAALPGLLERWVVFALTRAAVEPRWQEPVVEAVRACTQEFADQFVEGSDSPARRLVEHLRAAGVDLHDRAAVQDSVRAYNAELLARSVELADDGPADRPVPPGPTPAG